MCSPLPSSLLAALLLPVVAMADESAYCRKVRARAAADAAQLMSPQLVVQGMRFPRYLTGLPLSDLESTGTSPYQARAGLAFSPLELVKGLALTREANHDCEQEVTQATLEEFLENAESSARLPALRSQVSWLEATAPRWRAVVGKEEVRFERHVITLFELNQVRMRGNALERQLVQAGGEAERLEARGYQRPLESPADLLQRSLSHSLQLERELSSGRTLSSWNVRLTAGVVASDRPLDWYGLAELSVHLGAPWQRRPEQDALAARTDELRHDRRGVEVRVHELTRHLGLLREQARRELELVEAQLASVSQTRAVLERSDSPDVGFAVSLLTCDEWLAQSERTYLTAFIDELSSLLPEGSHG